MKMWLFGAYFLCLLLPAALGLKCYVCSSSKSWEDCKTTSHTCPAGYDMCSKVYLKTGGIEAFRKYCVPRAGCSQNTDPTCKDAVGSSSFKCDISCCDSDNCNAGTAFRISGILLLTCALVSLWIVVKNNIQSQ